MGLTPLSQLAARGRVGHLLHPPPRDQWVAREAHHLTRLQLCLKVLSDKTGLLSTVFNTDCREAQVQVEGTSSNGMEKKVVSIQPDSPINFLQLSNLYSLVGAGDILDISLNQILWRGRILKADCFI